MFPSALLVQLNPFSKFCIFHGGTSGWPLLSCHCLDYLVKIMKRHSGIVSTQLSFGIDVLFLASRYATTVSDCVADMGGVTGPPISLYGNGLTPQGNANSSDARDADMQALARSQELSSLQELVFTPNPYLPPQ